MAWPINKGSICNTSSLGLIRSNINLKYFFLAKASICYFLQVIAGVLEDAPLTIRTKIQKHKVKIFLTVTVCDI